MINKINTTPDRQEIISKINETVDATNNTIPSKDKGKAGGVAQLSSSGHLMMPDGSEIWVE